MKAPDTQIGVTLYNLRDYCKTEDDLARTLERVRKIGYQVVQISGIGPIAPQAVKKRLDENELYCCATHEGLGSFKTDLDSIVEKLNTWECDFTAIGSAGNDYWSADGVVTLAGELDEIGAKLREKGIKFAFHNHHREFERFTEKTFLQELFDRTNPDNVGFELDLHWVQRGGGSPVSWIKKAKGRMHVCHFKDYAILNHEPVFCEIGEGNLEWDAILKACEEADCRWYVFEQDRPFGDRDIFDSIKITYDNMKKMGVK